MGFLPGPLALFDGMHDRFNFFHIHPLVVSEFSRVAIHGHKAEGNIRTLFRSESCFCPFISLARARRQVLNLPISGTLTEKQTYLEAGFLLFRHCLCHLTLLFGFNLHPRLSPRYHLSRYQPRSSHLPLALHIGVNSSRRCHSLPTTGVTPHSFTTTTIIRNRRNQPDITAYHHPKCTTHASTPSPPASPLTVSGPLCAAADPVHRRRRRGLAAQMAR